MIRLFLYLQLIVVVVVGAAILFFVGKEEALSFVVGGAFSLLNTTFLVIIVRRIFAKKSVALSFILIIFKYLAFGLGLYYLVTGNLLKVSWFVVGLSMLVMTVIGLVFIHYKQIKSENNREQEREKNPYGTF